ncbi:heavy metal translocating P-type ATPase [Embleya hyalina]|uniref:Carbonate dehydratase n=1 Tax=Embleya hyalina TaxID=516124 RepID=A0A401YIZ6_9ACTN|nr:heavy metal translocating P-type ATPase [Embleya hyalina]GCD94585.1 carbonate dehydratase [Embleya hyalina]
MTTSTRPITTDVTVSGMTCGACVHRVERRLARLDGVTATVNLATGRARVVHPASLPVIDVLAAITAAGYEATVAGPTPAGAAATGPAAEAIDRGRRDLLIVAALALPVLVLSMVPAWQFTNWQWLCLTLAAPVATWGAWPFHRRALHGLRYAGATMDTLVSLGVLAAFGWSLWALFGGGAGEPGMRMPFTLLPPAAGDEAHMYLEVAVAVPLFVLLGRRLEDRARTRTGSALRELAALVPDRVAVLHPGPGGKTVEVTVPTASLTVGQVFVVRPGDRVPADGVVVDGRSALDVSHLTGESRPMEVGPEDRVPGGSVNEGGRITARATAVGADTRLARITAAVEEAQAGKTGAQRLADRIAGVFVPSVLATAVTVLGFWLGAGGDPQAAAGATMAVLVVACPCALGLATPTAILAATGRGARLGVLIREPAGLERLRRVGTVVVDKTGTLTTGGMSLLRHVAAPDVDPGELLARVGAVESASGHPIGRALARAAGERVGTLPPVADFAAEPGIGVRGLVDGSRVAVLRPGVEDVTALPARLRAALSEADAAGDTAVVATVNGVPAGVLVLGDSVRPEAAGAIRALDRLGVTVILATGDRPGPARAVADAVGIDEVLSELDPHDKAELVRGLRQDHPGRAVAVVGDGINDTIALGEADLGIGMGGGTAAAIGVADVTLVRDDLSALADAIRLSRRTTGTIRANLGWAFGYNVVLIPIAVTGLLNPMLAAAAMSVSSLAVVTNSLRLTRFRAGRPDDAKRDRT